MMLRKIRCNTCKKESDVYLPPPEWITTKQWDRYGNEEQKCFCSKVCLAQWANGESNNRWTGADQLQDLQDFMQCLTRTGMAPTDVVREGYNYAVAMMPPELSVRESLDAASQLLEQVTKSKQEEVHE